MVPGNISASDSDEKISNNLRNSLLNYPNDNSPEVILQAHMDMVIAGSKPPEEAVVNAVYDGNVLRTDGETTLGADNGIGIATILSILRLGQEKHGPLRVLFTVSEEIGLKGARVVPKDWLSGAKYMINTDGFHSDTEVVGCKGGLRETFSRKLKLERISDKVAFHTRKKNQIDDTELYEIKLQGYLGGHSGDDIDKGRCNTICQLAEILQDVQDHFDMRITYLNGGAGYNVIPAECTAVVAVPRACRISVAKLLLKDESELHELYEKADPTGKLTVKWLGETCKGNTLWEYDFQRDVLHFLTHIHELDGVNTVNFDGEVSSSSNLGRVYAKGGILYIGDMIRCDTLEQEKTLLNFHRNIAEETGFEVSVTGYHSWHSSEFSHLANTVGDIYERDYGVPMRRKVAKVGLEPAFFHEAEPDMEIVCLGAEISNAHSVKERVLISSIGVLYRLITETLERLAVSNNP